MRRVAERPVSIANCSGFYGDRLAAPHEMLSGPAPIDVLTGDYLAELTMLILWKARQRDPAAGYARTFLAQMEEVLGTCLDRRVKVVTNAGGLNPRSLAERLRELGERLGTNPQIAVVDGDDILDRIAELQQRGVGFEHLDRGVSLADAGVKPVTANAYLGGWGIAAALAAGAEIVVCGRVTDAALTLGPAAWWHSWARDDWDALAGAVVAGHVIECGPQATGGNYPFLDELSPGLPGFPIAEVAVDGSSVITKQPGSGGAVSVGTVTAQLLYEIDAPRYATPDVVARFDTIALTQVGRDRVQISEVHGEPPPSTLKVAINYPGGYRNSMTMVLTGLDIDRKAAHAAALLFDILGGREQFDVVDVQILGRNDETAQLRVTVKDADPGKVGRRFSNAVTELALASYAGFFTTTPPGAESEYGVYWPALVPAEAVEHAVVLPDGRRVTIEPGPRPAPGPEREPVSAARLMRGSVTQERIEGPTERRPLGTICGARSGDKGGNANVGLWTRTDDCYQWLQAFLTVDRFRALVPEAATLVIERYELANLRALNFVVKGILGEGVASSVRDDPQAKGLGEYVRARLVDIPVGLSAGVVAAPGSEALTPES